MKPEERLLALQTIARDVAACKACPLHRGRVKVVPGDGSITADIMFIGEAPGYHEDQQGIPFVGASGHYLEHLLGLIGLKRQDVFIANVVKCRPPSNRDPLPEEMEACKDYIDRQVELINPVVIATLGRYSMGRYFPNAKISTIHGKPKFADGRVYLPLFHPAAILRNDALRPVMEQDFKQIPALVEQMKSTRVVVMEEAAPLPKEEPPNTFTQLSLF
jgi:uracil-DNA glycosylase